MKNGKTLIAAITAAFAGILFAPRKGSVTRKKISEKSREYVDKLNNKFRKSSDNIASQLKDGKKKAQKAIEKGEETVQEASEKVNRPID